MLKFVLLTVLLLVATPPAFAATVAKQDPAVVEATLKDIIVELSANQVDDARYSADLGAEIKRQRDFIVPTLTAAGPLKSLKFLDSTHPVPDQQVDRFLAEHENTSFVWTISQDPGGVVTLLVLAPPRSAATPEEKQTALAGATLTEIIGELRDGRIVDTRYSKPLTAEMEAQRAAIVPALVAAGPLTTLKFLNATRAESGQGINQFLAEHEGADFLWTVSLDREGVVTLQIVQPAD
jgi:phage-related protein